MSDSESVYSSSTIDDPSYDPGSETERYEFRQSLLYNYVAEAKTAILRHDDITIDNALVLNQKYTKLLVDLKTKLETLLQQCQDKYQQNEKRLEVLRSNEGKKTKRPNYNSFYICGAPYFKDVNLNPAPPNPDYIYRRDVLKEVFPFDLISQPKRYWTSSDKTDILAGIKKQMINHIQRTNSLSISSIRKEKAVRSSTKKIQALRSENTALEKKSVEELWAIVQADSEEFVIDWELISFNDLDSRHTPNECHAMWRHFLRPGINRGSWTADEDEILLDAVIRNNGQDWDTIAAALRHRSPLQCFIHYRAVLSEDAQVKKNTKFDPAEDELLMELVEKYRDGDNIYWSKVCQHVPGRNRYQCYHRYMFTLKPDIRKDRFTTEEDCIIMAYVQEHGENFAKLPPNLLPGRTPVQIRNRYNNTLKHTNNKQNQWTVAEDQALVDFVSRNGTNMWATIAKELGTKTRFACRCRYNTIQKYLQKNPTARVEDVPRKSKSRSSNVTSENWRETIVKIKEQEELKALNIDDVVQRSVSKLSAPSRIGRHDGPLHEYLKFSYDFNYAPPEDNASTSAAGREDDVSPPKVERLYTTLQLLDFELTETDFIRKFESLLPSEKAPIMQALQVEVPDALKADIRQAKSNRFVFPPNWNTTVGYRGVALLAASLPDEPFVKLETRAFKDRFDLFRQRFFQLFYWPAILAQIMASKVRVPPMSGQVAEEEEVEATAESAESEEPEEDAVAFLLNYVNENANPPNREEIDYLQQVYGTEEPELIFEITCLDEQGERDATTEIVQVTKDKKVVQRRKRKSSGNEEKASDGEGSKPVAKRGRRNTKNS